jgi:hypothetical protein
MDYLIAPTLFKNKTCRLPGIGTISVITNTAETDFVNTQIKAPVPTIVFSVSQDDENVFNEFTALSELIKKDLDEKGSVTLRGIGDFIKDEEGVISFIPQQINPAFTPPVIAERVIRQDAEHAILVGDKETTNTVMTEYFEEEEEKKDRWWIWAIVLGAIGTGVLVYYLLQHDGTNLGNAVSM